MNGFSGFSGFSFNRWWSIVLKEFLQDRKSVV